MFKNLIELTKVRIGFLVLTTTIIGFYLGSQGTINNLLLLYTVLGTLLSSTGSSVMNNVFESESDKLMDRTKNRVHPTKKISIKKWNWLENGTEREFTLNENLNSFRKIKLVPKFLGIKNRSFAK